MESGKALHWNMRNRRQFLLEAGIVVAGAAASPLAFAAKQQKPGLQKMRGLMVDAARLPETLAYYRRVIEFCSEWEFNTLQVRLTDDQGSALRFSSVPDLVTHQHAFTPDELRSLVEYGRSHGVDLIPEVESFGHTGFITRSPAYAHLSDSDPVHGEAEFTGIIPVDPQTLPLFEKLYREVATIFSSAYLHGGCDEVNWGGSALSRAALQSKGRAQVWAEYLNALYGISAGLGKQFIVWGDFVLRKEPQILERLNKKIVIMDWEYADNSSANFRDALEKVSAHGSRAIGAPALTCYRWGARVGTEQLRNIDAVADAYFPSDDPNALGVILTNWVPSRYVQNSIWDGFAYAAVAFQQGTATAHASGFRRFVEKHYRAQWNEMWDEAFALIYDEAPYRTERETATWMGLPLPLPWSSDEQLKAVLKDASPRSNPFTHLRGLLVQLEPLVMKNLVDFQAFALSVEYLERMFWREAVVVAQATHSALTEDASGLLIHSIAERDQQLLMALTADWDRGRFPDSPAKHEAIFLLDSRDQLLYQWNLAAAYSASLAEQPNRFYQLLQAAQHA